MQWYRNLKTAYKLLLEFGLTTALLAIVGIVGVTSMARMEANFTTIFHWELAGMANSQDAELYQAMAAESLRKVFLAKNSEDGRKHLDEARQYAAESRKCIEQALPVLTSPAVKAEGGRARVLMEAWTKQNDIVMQLASQGKMSEALAVMASANGITDDMRVSLRKLTELTEQTVDQAQRDSTRMFEQARLRMVLVSCISVICTLALGTFAARSISVPLRKAAEVLHEVGLGRLTARLDVTGKDEVGQMSEALNQAVSNLRNFLSRVSTSALDMASASRELAAASRNLANGVNQHAAGQEETTVTLEQLTVTVQRNAESAGQASVVARESQKKAEAGGAVVASTVAAMDQVKASSHRISDIISTVDDIAFQTNLLALNAAVEAARAGELGRGFAVVASEVRSLAQRSAQAAREIKGLIQDSVQKVDKASELVNRSGNTLSEILDSGNRVTQFVHEIATASRDQATGILQATQAVSEMGNVTHGNAAQTEELSATAHRLAEAASELELLVQGFVTK